MKRFRDGNAEFSNVSSPDSEASEDEYGEEVWHARAETLRRLAAPLHWKLTARGKLA